MSYITESFYDRLVSLREERLDELSRRTYGRYLARAVPNKIDNAPEIKSLTDMAAYHDPSSAPEYEKNAKWVAKQMNKRTKGIELATKRLSGVKPKPKSPPKKLSSYGQEVQDHLKNKEDERKFIFKRYHLKEVSRKLLGRYINKATTDATHKSYEAGGAYLGDRDSAEKTADRALSRKINNRSKGLELAIRKISTARGTKQNFFKPKDRIDRGVPDHWNAGWKSGESVFGKKKPLRVSGRIRKRT